MRKLLFLILLVSTAGFSQAFMEFQFDAKRGTEDAIFALTDEFWGEAEFKSGGINIESINIGNEKASHRVLLYGDPANWGRVDTMNVNQDKWEAFVQKLNNHIEDWTHSSSGHVLSWENDDSDDYKYVQIYDLIAYDQGAFKAAHDKIVKKFSDTMEGRAVGFGTYQIGGYKGATHWVAVAYKNWADLMTKTRELQERKKEWAEYYQNRGKVQSIRNYTIYIDKSY